MIKFNIRNAIVSATALVAGSAFAAAPAAFDTSEIATWVAWAVAAIGAVFAATVGIPLAKRAYHAVTSFLGR